MVEDLHLVEFYAPYEGDGRRKSPYEPRMMLKILLYAYTTGVFSSRKIAKKLEEDVAMRVLAANNFPQHRTICDFRNRHLEDFKSIFIQVVQIAHEARLVRLGTVAIDGTKVKASKHKAMSYGRMQPEAPASHHHVDHLLPPEVFGEVAKPVVGRIVGIVRPLDDQPLFVPRPIAVCGPHTHPGKTRAHRRIVAHFEPST